MSEYSGIRGTRVKYLASDPTLNTSTEGQVWYNSTEGVLKSLVQIKAWSTGGNLPTATYAMYGAGIQTAALGSGGYSTGGSYKNATYEYNGFAWSSGGNLGGSTAYGAGFGTQTAAIAAGGFPGPGTPTFEYDGSAWTAGGALSTGRLNLSGFGILTSGAVAGGNAPGGPPRLSNTEEYDGSTWTAGGGLNTARGDLGVAGTLTAGLAFGGNTNTPSFTNTTEHYDGSSWTTVPGTLNTARSILHASSGTQTAALGFGGFTPSVTGATEEYDGSSWITSSASLATARARNNSATNAPKNASLSFGGYNGTTSVTATEEYVSSIDAYSPSTVSAWASTSNYLTPNSYLAGFGTITAGVATGGDGPPGTGITTTGEYDGSSWTTGGTLGAGRRGLGAGTNSTLTAGLVFGGADTAIPTQYSLVEEYNGSTWSEVNNLPGNQANVGGFGTQTAGACLPNTATATLEYDGTNWTSGGSLSNPRNNTLGIGCGTQTAGLAVGGGPAAPLAGDTEEYNGTTWTAGGDYPRAIDFQGSSGIQTSALISGGRPGANTDSGTYDGTAFSTAPNMGTGRYAHAGVGSTGSSTGLAVTGRTPSRTNAVEEFTEGSPISPTGAQASTLTTS